MDLKEINKKELADKYYNQILDFEKKELERLEKYKLVNEFLKSNDWLFISPIFFQGYELDIFLEISKTKKNYKNEIFNLIIAKFYNLEFTASFVEGYCSRCNYINPFLKSIEHSLILCFQKDYEGSIKTLIPIIEGILRKYLITEKKFIKDKIFFDNLRDSFGQIKSDIILICIQSLKNYQVENQLFIKFSESQIKDLINKREEYFNIWFSFVTDFVDNSFYMNTKGKTISNEINRHSIVHELGFNFEYSFENYVKVYFLLQFLTWAFLEKEDKSQFNEINHLRLAEKISAYQNIIKLSEKLLPEKYILLKNYN